MFFKKKDLKMSKEIKKILEVSRLLCRIVDNAGLSICLSSVLIRMNYSMFAEMKKFIVLDSGKSGPWRSCFLEEVAHAR